MVNQYVPPPVDNAPATRAEADARNTIGNENRANVGLGSYGESERYYQMQREIQQVRDQQTASMSRQDVDRANQREMEATGGGQGFRHTSAFNEAQGRPAGTGVVPVDPVVEAYTSRPRYTATEDLGNKATQRAVEGSANKFAEIGVVLERQRQAATTTHDKMFYENELAKWNAQRIERGEAVHEYGLALGVPTGANPYENVQDIALAFEKAGNTKDNFDKNYAFNPNVKSMMTVLPQYVDKEGNVSPVGLQDYAWRSALGRDGKEQVGNVSFTPAVDYINSQEGRMGVYGDLAGGVKDTFTAVPAGTKNGGFIGPGANTYVPPVSLVSTPQSMFAGMNIVSVELANQGLNPNAGKVTYSVQSTPNTQTGWDVASNTVNGVLNMFGMQLPTKQGFATETITEKTVREVDPNLIMSGAPAATWRYIGADNKPTPVMDFKTGNPYLKDNQIYQDYIHSDLSKFTVTETNVTTRTEPSAYDVINTKMSAGIPKISNEYVDIAKNDYIGNFVVQGYQTAAENPLDVVKNAAFGVALIGGAEIVGGAVTGLTAGTRFAGTVNAVGTVAPWVLGGMYAESVVARSTENFSDFTPAASGRFGGILSTETGPMIAGGALYAYSPRLNLNVDYKYNLPSYNTMRNGVSDFIFRLRQQESGIEKIGPRSGLSYYVEEPYMAPRGLPDYTKTGVARTEPTQYQGYARTGSGLRMIETNVPEQLLLQEIPQSMSPKQVPMDQLMKNVFPEEVPLWKQMAGTNTRWKPQDQNAALNYIRDRYPGQSEIWNDYLGQTQKVVAREPVIKSNLPDEFMTASIFDKGFIERYQIRNERGDIIQQGIGNKPGVLDIYDWGILNGAGNRNFAHVHPTRSVVDMYPSPEDIGTAIRGGGSGEFKIYSDRGITKIEIPEKLQYVPGDELGITRSREVSRPVIFETNAALTKAFDNSGFAHANNISEIPADIVIRERRNMLYNIEQTVGVKVTFEPYNEAFPISTITKHGGWKPTSKEAGLDYIKARYPNQKEIWGDYLTETQELKLSDAWSAENSAALRKSRGSVEDYGIDTLFKEVAIEKGAIGKPVRINTFEEFNAIKSDYPTLYRGVRGEERVTQFFDSVEPHASVGMQGSGVYTAKDFVNQKSGKAFSGYKTALDYGENVIAIKLLPDAKVATKSQLSTALDKMYETVPEDIMFNTDWNNGRVGLISGFDAVDTGGYEMLILNKNKVAAIYDNSRWKPASKDEALVYIKDKYRNHQEIWNDYLTQTQTLDLRKQNSGINEQDILAKLDISIKLGGEYVAVGAPKFTPAEFDILNQVGNQHGYNVGKPVYMGWDQWSATVTKTGGSSVNRVSNMIPELKDIKIEEPYNPLNPKRVAIEREQPSFHIKTAEELGMNPSFDLALNPTKAKQPKGTESVNPAFFTEAYKTGMNPGFFADSNIAGTDAYSLEMIALQKHIALRNRDTEIVSKMSPVADLNIQNIIGINPASKSKQNTWIDRVTGRNELTIPEQKDRTIVIPDFVGLTIFKPSPKPVVTSEPKPFEKTYPYPVPEPRPQPEVKPKEFKWPNDPIFPGITVPGIPTGLGGSGGGGGGGGGGKYGFVFNEKLLAKTSREMLFGRTNASIKKKKR